jgi:hypothetical protein
MPLGSVSPFRPTGTVSVSAGNVSSNTPLSGGGDSVVVTNATTALAYVRFGSDTNCQRLNHRHASTGRQPGNSID